jgi:hypothetical protein
MPTLESSREGMTQRGLASIATRSRPPY